MVIGWLQYPRSMDSAPKDGTHILAKLYSADRNFIEWREVYRNPFIDSGESKPWHAGSPIESFSDDRLISWVPLPNDH